MFTGPLPPPVVLEGYEAVVPGSAERIMAMAEKEQDHRHSREDEIVRIFSRGQWLAFVLGVLALGSATLLLALGRDIGGFTTLLFAVAAIVGAFLLRRRHSAEQETDRADREDREDES